MVVEVEEASTSFLAVKKPIRFVPFHSERGIHFKKSWMYSTTVCDTSKIRRSRHAWPWPQHAQSDWVRLFKTETENGTPARVEAETWKFARERRSSWALRMRGLYVLWNYLTPPLLRAHASIRSLHFFYSPPPPLPVLPYLAPGHLCLVVSVPVCNSFPPHSVLCFAEETRDPVCI